MHDGSESLAAVWRIDLYAALVSGGQAIVRRTWARCVGGRDEAIASLADVRER